MRIMKKLRFAVGVMLVSLSACSGVQTPAPVVGYSFTDRDPAIAQKTSPNISPNSGISPSISSSVSPSNDEIIPEFYTVQPGDNLFRIASRYGLKYREIAALNNINPDTLSIGQVIRLRLPSPITSDIATKTPYSPPSSTSIPTTSIPTPSTSTLSVPSTSSAKVQLNPEGKPRWQKPTSGEIIEAFKPGSTGIKIGGVEGQAVRAVADGRVVYADNAIRGYGNLILIQHSDGLITAYANNKTIMVKVNDNVKANQQIAQMGLDSLTHKPSLKFELRRAGNPIDPTPYLVQ